MFPPCSRPALSWLLFSLLLAASGPVESSSEDTQLVGDGHLQVSNRRLLLVASNASLVSNRSCPGGIAPVKCKADPCLRRKCDEDETCVVHNCFRCKATCRKNRAPSVDPPQQDTASQCSDGSTPVRCLVNPCATIWCRADQVCEANYCGGCTASCKKLLPSTANSPSNSTSLNATTHNSTTSGTCSDGTAPVACLVDPCLSATCSDGQMCKANYCGGCNAVCNKPTHRPHDDIHWVPAPTSCADGSAPLTCLVDPCEAKNCAAGEHCLRDFCGGCTAVCAKPPASNNTEGGSCSDGSRPFNCLVDPCISDTCLEGEVCESNYCGGCNAICKKAAGSLPVDTVNNDATASAAS